MMEFFERTYYRGGLQRESREMWKRGYIYANGEANASFLAFREGVAYGIGLQHHQEAASAETT